MILFVDLFAGGGGASEGIRRATGLSPDIAINHDLAAIRMHERNHPDCVHYHSDIFQVMPWDAVGAEDVDLLWASPDCTHFSRAKGGKPRSQKIRDLAWAIVRWAEQVQPEIICMENVPEFLTWGPLGHDDKPIRERQGETFAQFLMALEELDYRFDWDVLNAADYGAPTSRKRFYLVARRDGFPIRWPEPSHGPGRPQPWRTAAECIDWDVPVRSIFDREKPLAEKTLARIAEGMRRYVFEAERPFLLNLTHGGRLEPIDEPFRTITAANRGEKALVTPFIDKMYGSARAGAPVTMPLSTVLAGGGRGGGHHALVAPALVRTDMHRSNSRCVYDPRDPLRTITSGGGHAVAAAMLINTRNGERRGQSPRVRDLRRPAPTVTAKGSQGAVVAAFLAKHYGGVVGQDLRKTLGTVTAKDHHSLVAAFLVKYYGSGGQWQSLSEPMHTIVSKGRFGLVTTNIGGEEYAVVDIGMRMLTPRELARAQGFGDDYVLLGTKTQQIAKIGNSVCPDVAKAIVEANLWSAAA